MKQCLMIKIATEVLMIFLHKGNPYGLNFQSLRISFMKKVIKTSTSKWSTEKSRRRIKNLRPARGGAS